MNRFMEAFIRHAEGCLNKMKEKHYDSASQILFIRKLEGDHTARVLLECFSV